MRVKQTAKKITSENENHVPSSDTSNDMENVEHGSCDNQNDMSDNEVEFLVECRRDDDGNQFLLDGTLVIEPAAVGISHEYKENQDLSKEINFDQFIKEMEVNMVKENNKAKNAAIVSKRNIPSFGPDLSLHANVKCTACNKKFIPVIGQTLFKHPLMEVILCSDCIENQKDDFFIIDKEDNKETLCRWCVEGGSLICCDFCPKSFCKSCIKRNLGRITLTEILNQDDTAQWRCFACDPKPIEPLKVEYRKVLNDSRNTSHKPHYQKNSKKPTEIVNKKRSITKAFPNDVTDGSTNITAAKVSAPSQKGSAKQSIGTGVLLNSMANFGTEWYMKNVKLRNILTEIDEIDSKTLLNAINSTKRCVEAFYSDIRNLEVEISKASTASDIPAVVSMFKSVYRHHIFNRFCQVKTRIDEDRKVKYPGPAVLQSVNTDFTPAGIKNTNSIPNLIINNIVSTAHGVNKFNAFPPSVIAQDIKNNGKVSSPQVMASIDLTDEPDKVEESNTANNEHTSVTTILAEDVKVNGRGRTSLASLRHVSQSFEANDQKDDIVDLCDDDDSRPFVTATDSLNIDPIKPLSLIAVDVVDSCE